MKSTCCICILSAATFLSPMSVEAQSPSMLEGPSGRPLWVSASAAADEVKVIDLDLIGSDHLRETVEKQRRALGGQLPNEKARVGQKPPVATIPESECQSRTISVDDRGGIGSSDNLAHLAVHSKMIVRGTIRAVDVGFSSGTPSSLLEVEVSEVLKGSAPKSPFYIDYPVARFKIGPFSFCNVNKGFEPRPGDEILLFAYSRGVGRDEALYAPRLDQMLFQSQDGVLFLPSPLKETPPVDTARTLDDVVSPLQSFLAMYGEDR